MTFIIDILWQCNSREIEEKVFFLQCDEKIKAILKDMTISTLDFLKKKSHYKVTNTKYSPSFLFVYSFLSPLKNTKIGEPV